MYGTDIVLGSLVVGMMALLSFVLKMTRPSAEQTSVFAGLITDGASCVCSDSRKGSTENDSGSRLGGPEDMDLSVEVLAAFVSAGRNVIAQVLHLIEMFESFLAKARKKHD